MSDGSEARDSFLTANQDKKKRFILLLVVQQCLFWAKVLVGQELDWDTTARLVTGDVSGVDIGPLSCVIIASIAAMSIDSTLKILLVFVLHDLFYAAALWVLMSWLDHGFHLNSRDLTLAALVFICVPPIFRTVTLADDNVFPLPFLLLALQEETQQRRAHVTGLLLGLALCFHIQSILIVSVLFAHRLVAVRRVGRTGVVSAALVAGLPVLMYLACLLPLYAVGVSSTVMRYLFGEARWSFLAQDFTAQSVLARLVLWLSSITKAFLPPFSMLLSAEIRTLLDISVAVMILACVFYALHRRFKALDDMAIPFLLITIGQLALSFIYEPEGLERWTTLALLMPLYYIWLIHDTTDLLAWSNQSLRRVSGMRVSRALHLNRTTVHNTIFVGVALIVLSYPVVWTAISAPTPPVGVFIARQSALLIPNPQSLVVANDILDGDPRSLNLYSPTIVTAWIRNAGHVLVTHDRQSIVTYFESPEDLVEYLNETFYQYHEAGYAILLLPGSFTLVNDLLPDLEQVAVPGLPYRLLVL